MSILADTAVTHLLHLPETLEKLVFPSPRSHENHRGHAQANERGFGSIPVDILETAKEYTFFLDVPGLTKSDIQVTLEEEEKTLVVKSGGGKRKREEGEEEGSRYLRLERRASAKFLRKFRLPGDANPSAISARCENGVLTVVVGKMPPPESKKKTVEVTVA
ncbi:17.4 kDa class III heat shock protein [Typha angustifolia]|uniref:17.4 kDa class III heat shock protein n=1 Tax=Typha angustifolia TaxID=59011 RepID=UPI003C2BC3DB